MGWPWKKHPPAPPEPWWKKWVVPSIVLAALGVVPGAVGVYFTFVDRQHRADLTVHNVRSYSIDDLMRDGQRSPASKGQPTGKGKAEKFPHGSLIDVTLRNSGNGDAVIYEITLKVRQVTSLEICANVGGSVEAAANYDFELPKKAPPGYDLHKTLDDPFAVKANGSADRFKLTINPKRTVQNPMIGVVDVVLHGAGDEQLTYGPVGIVGNQAVEVLLRRSPDGRWTVPDNGQDGPGCVRRNAKKLAEVSKQLGARASDNDQLVLLNEQFQKHVRH